VVSSAAGLRKAWGVAVLTSLRIMVSGMLAPTNYTLTRFKPWVHRRAANHFHQHFCIFRSADIDVIVEITRTPVPLLAVLADMRKPKAPNSGPRVIGASLLLIHEERNYRKSLNRQIHRIPWNDGASNARGFQIRKYPSIHSMRFAR